MSLGNWLQAHSMASWPSTLFLSTDVQGGCMNYRIVHIYFRLLPVAILNNHPIKEWKLYSHVGGISQLSERCLCVCCAYSIATQLLD